MPSRGKVYLVGAGPGDPGLITVRGMEIVRQADVVFYDNLATPELLRHAKPGAETIYVGKKRAEHVHSQDEINAMLVEQARRGRIVARLKGGDPYIFGRGGEEGEALADAGVEFEVVPGVSSATGVAAYAGIPLTHRERTAAVTFVTGHEVERVDWNKLGVAETLVIFMGLTTFDAIARRLIQAGRSPATPAAAVRWGTRPDQQTVIGTLADLASRIAAEGLKPPALIVVGEVVGLRPKLSWFERLPLFGRRIVVTRASDQAGGMLAKLRQFGAEAIEIPAIEIGSPDHWAPLDRAIAVLECYDWLLFTSQNGVAKFVERLDASPHDLRAIRGKIAAIGPATAKALEDLHLKVDLMPGEYVAEAVLERFAGEDLAGRRILLARAAVARDVLPRELSQRGARVDVVPAYRTSAPAGLEARIAAAFDPPPGWVTFTSSSTARHFVNAAGAGRLRTSKIASIGPVTSATVREMGLEVAAEARAYTVDGLIEALIAAEQTG